VRPGGLDLLRDSRKHEENADILAGFMAVFEALIVALAPHRIFADGFAPKVVLSRDQASCPSRISLSSLMT